MKKILKMILVICICLILQINIYTNVNATTITTTGSGKKVYAQSIKITNNKSIYYIGETFELKTSITPSDSTDKTVTWSSSDSSIASVDKNGKLTGKKKGTVKITATTSNGKSDSVAVTIKNNSTTNSTGTKQKTTVDVTDIKISNNPDLMLVGESTNLNATVSPSNASDKTVTWSSSDTKIITVDKNGKITAKGVGEATITAKTSNGKSDSVKINVISIELSEKNININQDESYEVYAIVRAADSYTKIISSSVKWTSSNSNSVNINYEQTYSGYSNGYSDDGKTAQITYKAIVNGKKDGVANVSFIIEGKKASFKVNVKKVGQDYSLECPTITYDTSDNSVIRLNVSPNSDIDYWIVEYSKNKKTGSLAQWSSTRTRHTGDYTLVYAYAIAQAKITVYSKTGTSRFCYSAPFDIGNKKNSNIKISMDNGIECPTITTKEELVSGTTSYVLNRYNTYKLHTGIAKVNITINPKKTSEGYITQYTWLTNQDNKNTDTAEWKLFNTSNVKKNFSLTTSTKNYNDRQGLIAVMNEYGDIRKCYTDIYSRINFIKKIETDGTNVYFEKGFSRIDEYVNFLKKVPKKYKVATANIFFLTADTYDKYVGGGQGISFMGNIVEKDGNGDYARNSVIHEMGHNLDSMYSSILSKGGMIRNHDDVKGLYNTLITQKSNASGTCDGYKYLREYSFQNGNYNGEFWADIIRYTYINDNYPTSTDKCPVSNDIYALKNKYIDDIEDNYEIFVKLRNKYK